MERQNENIGAGENKKRPDSSKTILGIVIGILVVIIIVLAVLLANSIKGGKNGTNGSKGEKGGDTDTIITIGNTDYTLADMMYYVYTEEEMGSLYEQFYQSFYGQSYWDMEGEDTDGLTGEEYAKQNIINNFKQDTVLYEEAVKAGYSLSDEDKETAQANYDEFVSALTEEQLAVPGMKDQLLVYFGRQMVLDSYKESLLDENEFDYDAVVETVDKDACREYKYEYFCIYKDDDDGNTYSKSEMKKMLGKLTALQKEITADNDMAALLDDDCDYVEYSDDYIVEEDGEAYGSYKDVDCDAVVKGLKNGEVSDVIETEFSYIVFRMNDNNSTEYYEGMVDEAVTKAEDEIYATAFDSRAEGYDIVLNEEAWNDVEIGSIIYDSGVYDEDDAEAEEGNDEDDAYMEDDSIELEVE